MSLAPAQVIAISAPRSLTIVGRAGGLHREHKRYSLIETTLAVPRTGERQREWPIQLQQRISWQAGNHKR